MSSLVPKTPDLKIFCFYHADVLKDAEAKGYVDPLADHVVYVKVVPGAYTYPCRHHLDLSVQPWAFAGSPRFGESAAMLSLYRGHRCGAYKLPEYVGTCHYDMRIASYPVAAVPMAADQLIAFCPYLGAKVMEVPCHAYILDLYLSMMRYHGVDPVACAGAQMVMCNAFIAHRDVYMAIMAETESYAEANDWFPRPLCSKKRDIGEALERLTSVLIRKWELRGIRIHTQRIHHALATACRRPL
ncbi:MAG: hypothetical protein BWY85_00144 [Firmicutes bacterium ADurb.Bin506]|nr:MAG: hypothetical protein BWY85_00144 [Firmicutes bacterium ADurb.Bin506]